MKLNTPLKRGLAAGIVLAAIIMSPPVAAHKINLFAYAEGDTVSVEGYFADGKKAQNSTVKVLDSSGTVLVEGVTDDKGKYLFKIPKREDINIVLSAGMGHRGEFKMSKAELGDGQVAVPDTVPVSVAEPVATVAAESKAGHVSATEAVTPVVGSELEAVVHHAVNEAIKPLVRELEVSRQSASISELVGAIGYIFGLLGVFAFYKARQIAGKVKSPKVAE